MRITTQVCANKHKPGRTSRRHASTYGKLVDNLQLFVMRKQKVHRLDDHARHTVLNGQNAEDGWGTAGRGKNRCVE